MMRRSAVTVVARALTAVFFLTTAAYCILSYNSFTYHQFIRPEVLAWPSDFVALHHLLYLATWLLTALTLVPHVRPPRVSWTASAYLVATAAVAVWLVAAPFMATIDNSPRSLIAGLVFLVVPLALAGVDHLVAPAPMLEPLCERKLLRTCAGAALAIWAAYAVAAPYRLSTAPGIDLPTSAMLVGVFSSGLAHAMTFAAIFLAGAALIQATRLMRGGPRVEYALLVMSVTAVLGFVLHVMVLGAVGLTGASAWLAAVMLAATITVAWSGAARHVAAERGRSLDAVELFLAPLHLGSAFARAAALAALPFLAVALAQAVEQLDWDFLLQKLGVLLVWVVAFAVTYASGRAFKGSGDHRAPTAAAATRSIFGAPSAVLVAYCACSLGAPALTVLASDARLSPELVLDRYLAVDPSFRFITGAARANTGEAAAFYRFLKAHSTIAHVDVDPVEIDFVRPLGTAPGDRPHIFLFVIDSLRRDYVSAYNPAVTFTPSLGAFARESFVFERAFSRYGATGLALPSIWVGGMTLHMQYIRPFTPMNTLLKLLDAAAYRRVMSVDSIVERINEAPRSDALTPLDKGIPTKQYDFCRTLDELGETLASNHGAGPIFGYTLPQNVHIANAFETPVPEGESYPGFVDKVAAPVRRIDRCFGQFVDRLKALGIYDESIIIVTSDHGDSLGEEGRFGHAYTVFPEVMRVPLIVHLPKTLAEEVTTDLARVSFSADITPTLYALLGYQPTDLGPLYGAPLFSRRGTPLAESRRRRDPFLLASSYGAVYGMLRHNGRALYIADAVAGRDYAYDLSDGGLGQRVEITDAMRDLNWRLIREQVTAIAQQYRFDPGD